MGMTSSPKIQSYNSIERDGHSSQGAPRIRGIRDGFWGNKASPMFLIPKKDGTMRGIYDLGAVNKYLPRVSFSLRGIRDSIRLVRECSWGVTLDLKKGYYQVLMRPEVRQYLGVEFGGKTTTANVLPFGLSIAPHVFQTLTAFVGRLVRQLTGVHVVVYLDDFLLGASSKEKLEQAVGKTRELFMKLGMVISPKCNLIPS